MAWANPFEESDKTHLIPYSAPKVPFLSTYFDG